MINIILIGFMGSGKTTIGKSLADQLRYHFLDTDSYIEKWTGMTISAIFDSHGEPYFRQIENRLAGAFTHLKGYVIATGGGMPIPGNNIDLLKAAGHVVYLHTEWEVVLQRVARNQNRPLANLQNLSSEAELHTRFIQREPVYLQAHQTVHCGTLSMKEIANQILQEAQIPQNQIQEAQIPK